ncbi:MAG TPA: class I SAM-dependent methyltransferase [Anaeromyxobacter sp.]
MLPGACGRRNRLLPPGRDPGMTCGVRLAVTTPLRPSPAEEAEARAAAARHGLPYAARGRRAAADALRASGAEALLVLSARGATLLVEGEERRWSPGMGALRAKRVRARLRGEGDETTRDPFLEAAGIREGDAVLDATLGLGADALVAAVAAGPRGRIAGVEASPALAAWVAEGLRRLGDEAAARIEVRASDHATVLASLPDRSFDLVVFDPMFRHARAEPAGFDLVRRLADPRPLSAEALERARRVARRWVLVKDGAPGWDLARLGLAPLPSARGAHRYYARVPAR